MRRIHTALPGPLGGVWAESPDASHFGAFTRFQAFSEEDSRPGSPGSALGFEHATPRVTAKEGAGEDHLR